MVKKTNLKKVIKSYITTIKKYKTKDKFVPKFKAGKGLKDAVAAAKK